MHEKKKKLNENYRVLPNTLILLRERKKKGKDQDNKQESEGFRLKKSSFFAFSMNYLDFHEIQITQPQNSTINYIWNGKPIQIG